MGSANERPRYIVTPSLIDWAHTQNDPCHMWPGTTKTYCNIHLDYAGAPSYQLFKFIIKDLLSSI